MAEEITDEDREEVIAVRDDLRAGLGDVLVQAGDDPLLAVRRTTATEADVDLVVTDGTLTAVAWEVGYDQLRLNRLGFTRGRDEDGTADLEGTGDDVVVDVSGVLTGVTIHDARTGLFHRQIDWLSALRRAGVVAAVRPQTPVVADDLAGAVAAAEPLARPVGEAESVEPEPDQA